MIGPTNANARYIKAISSSTNDHVVTFNGTGGNSIQDSGKTIGVSIPAPNTSTDVGMSLVVQNDGSLSYGVPPGNYVTLDTQQTVTGIKTFSKMMIGKATRHVTTESDTTNQYRKIAELTGFSTWVNAKYIFRISSSVNVTTSSNQIATFSLAVTTNGSSEIENVFAQFLSQSNAVFNDILRIYWDTTKVQIWIDFGSLVQYHNYNLELLHTWDRTRGVDVQNSYSKLTLMNESSATLPTGMTLITVSPTLVATPNITSTGKEIINAEWVRSTEVDSTTNLSKNGLVHNTGNEAIGGTKTFTNDMYIVRGAPNLIQRDTGYGYNEVVTHGRWELQDKNAYRLSMHRVETSIIDSENNIYQTLARLTAHTRNANNQEINANFTIHARTNGDVFALAPWKSSPTEGGEVLTMGNGVTLRTVQTLSAQKIFAGELPSSEPADGATSTPMQFKFYGGSANKINYANIIFLNKDNKISSFVGPFQSGSTNSNGLNGFRLGFRNREDTAWTNFLNMYSNGSITWDGSITASNGFVGNVTGNCSGSAGSVAWGNVSSKPTFVNNGTSGTVAPSAALSNGFWYVSSSTSAYSGADANPFYQFHTANADFRIMTTAYSDIWLQQLATDFRTNRIFIRRKENGTWNDWVQLRTTETVKVSSSAPSGGIDGDVWIQY